MAQIQDEFSGLAASNLDLRRKNSVPIQKLHSAKKLIHRNSEEYFIDEEGKSEALLKFWKDKEKAPHTKDNELNEILDNFYSAKRRNVTGMITTGTVTGSIFSLLSISFGSNILTLPYTIKKVGVILGIIIYVISSFIAYKTLKILMELSFKTGYKEYIEVVEHYLGKKWAYLTLLINLLSNFGSIIIYIEIISSSILNSFQFFGIFQNIENIRLYQMLIFFIFFELPLCFFENIRPLHIFSFFSTFMLLFVIIVSFFENDYVFFYNLTSPDVSWWNLNRSIFQVFCMYFFTFNNHNPILNVVAEITSPTLKRLKTIVNYASLYEFLICLVVMIVGYFGTLGNTPVIFINRPNQSMMIIIGKIVYAFALLCDIALYYYMCVPYLELIFNKSEKFNEKKSVISAVTLMFLLNAFAYWQDQVANMVSIVGATAAIYLMFIMPLLMYTKDNKKLTSINLLLIYLLLFTVISIGLIHISIVVGYNFSIFSFI